jgi:hypothetical protein
LIWPAAITTGLDTAVLLATVPVSVLTGLLSSWDAQAWDNVWVAASMQSKFLGKDFINKPSIANDAG